MLRKVNDRKEGKNKEMKNKEETELKKVILMTTVEKKTRGNVDERKGKMKNKRMLDGK